MEEKMYEILAFAQCMAICYGLDWLFSRSIHHRDNILLSTIAASIAWVVA